MYISPKKIAERMVSWGIDPEEVRNENYEDWTNTFADVIEDLYGLERKVRDAIVKL